MSLTKVTHSMIDGGLINLLDLIPINEHAAIQSGTSTYDCTTALAAANATDVKNIILGSVGTFYFPNGFAIKEGTNYDLMGATIKGNGITAGIIKYGTETYRASVRNGYLDSYAEGVNSEDIYQSNFYALYTTNCAVGWALRGTSYYNSFFGCHTELGTVVGLKTYAVGATGPNTNFFHGCKLYGTTTCVDLGLLTNVCFYGGSVESGAADNLLLMDGNKRCAFFGTRFEGKTGALMDIKVASEDNAFYQCTISASNTITDNGTRTTWFGGQGSAYDYLLGYSLRPNDYYAAIGTLNSVSDLWYRLNGKQLNLAEEYDAINLKTNLSGAEPGFAVKSTGVLRWSNGTDPYDVEVFRGTAGNLRLRANWQPAVDNSFTLGSSGFRWSVVYAATGAINTSDENLKQNITELSETEKRVASRIKKLIRTFKYKDAVAVKDANARIHVGVIAQDVKAAFDAEGLDAHQYGMFCSDTLKNGTNRLGVRYEELLAFVLAVS